MDYIFPTEVELAEADIELQPGDTIAMWPTVDPESQTKYQIVAPADSPLYIFNSSVEIYDPDGVFSRDKD